MSDSYKARYTREGKVWKDSVLKSRSQTRAWSKCKRIRAQQERSRGKAETAQESKGWDRPEFVAAGERLKST
jgi:hypothetical protein